MKAVCWYGTEKVRVTQVDDARVLQPTDAVIEVRAAAICGSDLHLYDGYIPTMKPGDILGHEAMGVVREVGSAVERLAPGDRVVVPFPIACGECWYCEQGQYSLCDNSNPNPTFTTAMYGNASAGYYGYSHAYGGFAGAQAERLRIPYADTGHLKVPMSLTDEQVLFLSDILPTGWMAADYCDIQPGDSVAVWGAGPVGQFAMLSAKLMGAGKVFAIDDVETRLKMAEQHAGAIPLYRADLGATGVLRELHLQTGGRGPDACIDCVGLEATDGALGAYHKVKQTLRLEQDRPIALAEAVMACRKGGTVSVAGVYTGMIDKFPMGAVFSKGITMRAGQTSVQHYAPELLGRIERHEIDPTFVITHRFTLDEAPYAYELFRDEKEQVVKVVLTP